MLGSCVNSALVEMVELGEVGICASPQKVLCVDHFNHVVFQSGKAFAG